MRAGSVEPDGLITVVAEDVEVDWKIVVDNEIYQSVSTTYFCSMLRASTILVID
jgi:hypothetical protein